MVNRRLSAVAVLILALSFVSSSDAGSLPTRASDPLATVLGNSTPVPLPATASSRGNCCTPLCRAGINATLSASLTGSSCGVVHVGLVTQLNANSKFYCQDVYGSTTGTCNVRPSFGTCTQPSPGVYQMTATYVFDCVIDFCNAL